ncbi:hypothetical protein AK812_SmicGene7142 [Symbiodinium microadriaticum]|uniref:Uncharacterized protein n=1 Tax=Symbiodinium microadriaticum TaxID=2951 RepID=A0A1Q9EPF9_SYMMI|nr:hypothetical protein AK812_SmicGene7142 [Symbiodinium microadriaticum]CAE7856843.1 unnamed protein product [Symbiodinium sp. KB8]
MLPYIPGLGTAAAGADSDADILDQAEPVSSPFRAHRQQLLNMRFEEMTPEESRRCTERAMQSVPVSLPVGQVGGSPHDSLSSRRSNAVFGSPMSASPTAAIEAERRWWADASERQLENLSQVVKSETARCFLELDKLKAQVKEEIRQESAALTDQFGAMLNSMEQRLRREQQAGHQAALEAARRDLEEIGSKHATVESSASSLLQAEPESIPTSPSAKSKRIDQFIEEIGLRVDGLHVKLEEQLTAALAEERKTRGKSMSDVCQYIEHMVGLQESDAKNDKLRLQDSISQLGERVQVLEEAMTVYLYNTNQMPDTVGDSGTGSGIISDVRPSTSTAEPGLVVPEPTDMAADVTLPLLPSNGRPSEDRTSPPHLSVFRNGGETALEPGDAAEYPQSSASSAQGVQLSLFSEDMRESLNNIVRKVGNTMTQEAIGSAAPSSAGLGPQVSLPASAPTLRPALATVSGSSVPPSQSLGPCVQGSNYAASSLPLRMPSYSTQQRQ